MLFRILTTELCSSLTMTKWLAFSFTVWTVVLATETVSDSVETPKASEMSVLNKHQVVYSEARIDSKYDSMTTFNPRGMEHVYLITHLFLDLIQRENVLPPDLNASALMETPTEKLPKVLETHWPELMLQYIGVITVSLVGILLAVLVPITGFCMCCCRCCGKCGGYPEHFDKKSDSCKRISYGVLLSFFVIAAMFGVVCAFVTNHYAHEGVQELPSRLQTSSTDTARYFDNTGKEIQALLEVNYAELEEVLFEVLDESGPILKNSLAQVTQAVAIDDLSDIVGGLTNVKRYLRDIQNETMVLQDKVGQLRLGLNGIRKRLSQALSQCTTNAACNKFMKEYSIDRDLALATDFDNLPTRLPNVSRLMEDISDLMNNDIEREVRFGQKQLDKVKTDIEDMIGDIRPRIKEEIKRMGKELQDRSAEIQRILHEMSANFEAINGEVPSIEPVLEEYSVYMYYIGLGMACLVLLILFCHILGLFYGFCGKRPGNVYGDDCCNRGTGANWLLSGVYLTFLFSFVLLVIATAQFLVGSTIDKVVCDAFKRPNESDVFELVDKKFIQPLFEQHYPADMEVMPVMQLIDGCHRNQTIYKLMNIANIYNVSRLRNWRKEYGIERFIDGLKNKIRLEDMSSIEILSPQAQADLEDLAESRISDMNFTQYTQLLEDQITQVDLTTFNRKLRQVSGRVGRTAGVKGALENEALFLEQMQGVVMDMKMAVRHLKQSVTALEKEAKFNKASMRDALRDLISQASKATSFLRSEGPELIEDLANQYVNETIGLIDDYVKRVINRTENHVGRCEPLSNSYNATVIAVCNEIVDPFNGFWASIGWCLVLFYIPAIAVAMSLVSLYRKSEPYPGPLVEHQPLEDNSHKAKKRRGHRRNASEYLPDSAHYRAGYSYQSSAGGDSNRFQDIAPRTYVGQDGAASTSGPPRYTSNPQLVDEYERPPPYYYPGPAPSTSDAPPPLPAPNRP